MMEDRERDFGLSLGPLPRCEPEGLPQKLGGEPGAVRHYGEVEAFQTILQAFRMLGSEDFQLVAAPESLVDEDPIRQLCTSTGNQGVQIL